MDRKRLSLLVIAVIGLLQITFAQTKVKIGDLYYHLSGVTASVVENSESTWARSEYRNDKYTVPDTITFNGLTFTVNGLDNYAFSSSNLYDTGSSASQITLPKTLKKIGESAFHHCKNLVSIVIPPSVETFGNDSYWGTFRGCDLLRTIIYLPISAPLHWTATTNTYVPDKQSYSSPTFRVNDANVIEMISFANNEFTYTGQAPTTTWTNNVEGYSAYLTIPTLKTDAGSYKEEIPVTFTKDGESFTTNVVYRYTISPAKLTAKVEDASREYGEDNPQFNLTYLGFISGDDENTVFSTKPIVSTTATKVSNVGEYPITISGGVSQNYEITYKPGVLTVTKATLSAKVRDTTKVYGAANPSFAIDYYGLKNDETVPVWTSRPSFQTDASTNSGVGQYEIKAVNAVPVNYDLGDISSGALTITPAPLTIKANDATRQYYSENPNFTYTCSGFVNGDNESVLSPAPTLSSTATLLSNVGTYAIKVSGASNGNYSFSYSNGTLTVTPRALIASVGNYERAYNEDNPTFKVSYEGFVGNDNDNTLVEKVIASTTASKTSDVGMYPINVSGGVAENYKFSYTSGTLTINKAYQTLTWNQDLSNISLYSQIELNAIASSDLPVTYALSNDTVCSLSYIGNMTYLDCYHYGTVTISAIQNGNQNYWPTTKSYKELNVANPTGIQNITYGTALNGKVSVEKGHIIVKGLDKSLVLRIYNLSGANVYSGGDCDIIVPVGVYIVKLGNSSTKLVVK